MLPLYAETNLTRQQNDQHEGHKSLQVKELKTVLNLSKTVCLELIDIKVSIYAFPFVLKVLCDLLIHVPLYAGIEQFHSLYLVMFILECRALHHRHECCSPPADSAVSDLSGTFTLLLPLFPLFFFAFFVLLEHFLVLLEVSLLLLDQLDVLLQAVL